jgi:hypothetical protein
MFIIRIHAYLFCIINHLLYNFILGMFAFVTRIYVEYVCALYVHRCESHVCASPCVCFSECPHTHTHTHNSWHTNTSRVHTCSNGCTAVCLDDVWRRRSQDTHDVPMLDLNACAEDMLRSEGLCRVESRVSSPFGVGTVRVPWFDYPSNVKCLEYFEV